MDKEKEFLRNRIADLKDSLVLYLNDRDDYNFILDEIYYLQNILNYIEKTEANNDKRTVGRKD